MILGAMVSFWFLIQLLAGIFFGIETLNYFDYHAHRFTRNLIHNLKISTQASLSVNIHLHKKFRSSLNKAGTAILDIIFGLFFILADSVLLVGYWGYAVAIWILFNFLFYFQKVFARRD